MTLDMTTLSRDLVPIYELEVSLNNRVLRIESPAGSNCPYAVIFEHPLHLNEITRQLVLPETIRFWEARDPHYPLEHGFVCEITRHAISGPIK